MSEARFPSQRSARLDVEPVEQGSSIQWSICHIVPMKIEDKANLRLKGKGRIRRNNPTYSKLYLCYLWPHSPGGQCGDPARVSERAVTGSRTQACDLCSVTHVGVRPGAQGWGHFPLGEAS